MKRILIVEDVALNRDLLTQLLEEDYELVIAVDGAAGVEMAAAHRPDLILMDLSLPLLDGWEATRCIKANATTARIPVVAITANAMSGDEERARGGRLRRLHDQAHRRGRAVRHAAPVARLSVDGSASIRREEDPWSPRASSSSTTSPSTSTCWSRSWNCSGIRACAAANGRAALDRLNETRSTWSCST